MAEAASAALAQAEVIAEAPTAPTPEMTIIHEMKLRDLQGLLRHRFRNDELVVDNYTYESLLPIGENYGSTMLKVHAVYREHDEDDSEQKELELVAKMMPPTDFQRSVFDSPYTFRKEAFLYQGLVPAYRQLERDFGVPEAELFDIVPGFYGVRYTLANVEADDGGFDEDAVILMENLKVAGYYTCDRKIGLDLEHARAAIERLARFHALGMAMKQHRPEKFALIRERSQTLAFKENSEFEKTTVYFKNLFKMDPMLSEYRARLERAMDMDPTVVWSSRPTEPWATIVHMDFWVNNIMFRRDEATGRVDDVKFVDFQNYMYMSPLRELAFFVGTNFRLDVMLEKFDELIDRYYDKFIGTLERMNCDTEPFARDKFDERMKVDAFEEFTHCPFMLQIMTKDVDHDAKAQDIKHMMMQQSLNSTFLERLRLLVKTFAAKGWL
ncbi:uncharacterized protein LOC106654804 [Trichogramma pretiosum]|uniref:uncharacterized protein LOC106654804 n=1 Tax=Trichogramma pretiosum TaxID=7493 RepID=UPI0006C9788D|nr:uncharacterized protein LOC106654804 [Trichogramma pretiosum]